MEMGWGIKTAEPCWWVCGQVHRRKTCWLVTTYARVHTHTHTHRIPLAGFGASFLYSGRKWIFHLYLCQRFCVHARTRTCTRKWVRPHLLAAVQVRVYAYESCKSRSSRGSPTGVLNVDIGNKQVWRRNDTLLKYWSSSAAEGECTGHRHTQKTNRWNTGKEKITGQGVERIWRRCANTFWICPRNRNLIICKRCHQVVRNLPIELFVISNTHEGSRYVSLKRDRRSAVLPTPEQINNWWVKIHHRTNSQSARCTSVRYRQEQNREEFLRHSCYRHMEKILYFFEWGGFDFTT